jgi:Homing endonuclease associated repeat
MLRAGASTDGQPWPWPNTVLSRLEARTWNQALTVAGLPVCAPRAGSRGVGDDQLVALVVDLQGTLGREPTPGEFGKEAGEAVLPGIQSVKCRFGSWESFLANAPMASNSGSAGLGTSTESDRDHLWAGQRHPTVHLLGHRRNPG